VRFLLTAAWLCVVGAAASLAFAATPVTPQGGATTSSHPVFTWTLAPDEESDAVHVANRPETTPAGEFHSENVVMTGAVDDATVTTWSPTEALFAGRYWWNVETRDADFMPAFSSVSEFTVAPEIRLSAARLSRSRVLRQITVDLRWVTNVREVTLELRLLRKGRAVGIVRRQAETLLSQEEDRGSLQWRAPRTVRTGTRLIAVVRVTGGGHAASLQRPFAAP
jgi:hypothetical protein